MSEIVLRSRQPARLIVMRDERGIWTVSGLWFRKVRYRFLTRS